MQVKHRAVLSLAVVCLLLSSVLSLSSPAGDVTTDAKGPPPVEKPAPTPAEEPAPPPEPAEPAPLPAEYFISKMVSPEYPEIARQKGLEAIVFRRDPAAPDVVVRVAVELGDRSGGWIEVIAGVGTDDELVRDGVHQLRQTGQGRGAAGGHFHADGSFHGGH